jgi:hypothetical protein
MLRVLKGTEGEKERTTSQEGPLPYTVLPGPSGPIVMGRGEITPLTWAFFRQPSRAIRAVQ